MNLKPFCLNCNTVRFVAHNLVIQDTRTGVIPAIFTVILLVEYAVYVINLLAMLEKLFIIKKIL